MAGLLLGRCAVLAEAVRSLMHSRRFQATGAALAALTWGHLAAVAQTTDFYSGKTVTFVISADAGKSAYDTYGRLIIQYLPKHIPGHPMVIVQNMPGAGGLRAANWLYNVAPKDGLTIGMVDDNMAFDPLFGDKLAQFDAAKFNWLGSPSKESALFVISGRIPVDNIDQARQRHLILSATGTGSTPAFYARVFAKVFNMNITIIPGYKSQGESFLAMERGENDGLATSFWSTLQSSYPSWVPDKKVKILLYYGSQRDAAIPGPYVLDLIKDPEKKSLMEVAQAGIGMGRPVLAPPGVSADKLKILNAAMQDVFKDPDFLAACAGVRLDCRSPSSGADLQALVEKTYTAPKPAVDQIAAMFMEGEGK